MLLVLHYLPNTPDNRCLLSLEAKMQEIFFAAAYFLLLARADGSIQQTCADYMWASNTYLSNGVYTIYNISNNNSIDVYCTFDYDHQYAFTLFTSGTLVNMDTTLDQAFTVDLPYNMDNILSINDNKINDLYRLSFDWMSHLQLNSDYIFVTCNFVTNFTIDWVLMDIDKMGYNILSGTISGLCINVTSINIRGHECSEGKTVRVWGNHAEYAFHIDSNLTPNECNCLAIANGSTVSEDNFGHYRFVNNEFSCSRNNGSTTNWWYGSFVEYKIESTETPSTETPSTDAPYTTSSDVASTNTPFFSTNAKSDNPDPDRSSAAPFAASEKSDLTSSLETSIESSLYMWTSQVQIGNINKNDNDMIGTDVFYICLGLLILLVILLTIAMIVIGILFKKLSEKNRKIDKFEKMVEKLTNSNNNYNKKISNNSELGSNYQNKAGVFIPGGAPISNDHETGSHFNYNHVNNLVGANNHNSNSKNRKKSQDNNEYGEGYNENEPNETIKDYNYNAKNEPKHDKNCNNDNLNELVTELTKLANDDNNLNSLQNITVASSLSPSATSENNNVGFDFNQNIELESNVSGLVMARENMNLQVQMGVEDAIMDDIVHHVETGGN